MNIKKEILWIIETIFISVFLFSMIFTYIIRPFTVEGSSMNPTLQTGDRILSLQTYGDFEKGDIVVCECEESIVFSDDGTLEYREGLNKMIVKRVIAVEGQTIDIDFEQGLVYVDDKLLSEEYISGLTHYDGGAFTNKYPITIPEGYMFVMGDNRENSRDSRDIMVGLVSEKSIRGKVILRVSPLSEFGILN